MSKVVVLFGASKLGEIAFSLMKDNYNILYYCDNDFNKWGKKINGIEVIPPATLKELTNVDVVITSSAFQEIAKQLQELSIFSYKVFKYSFEDVRIGLINSTRKRSLH